MTSNKCATRAIFEDEYAEFLQKYDNKCLIEYKEAFNEAKRLLSMANERILEQSEVIFELHKQVCKKGE